MSSGPNIGGYDSVRVVSPYYIEPKCFASRGWVWVEKVMAAVTIVCVFDKGRALLCETRVI